jgi:hypothetical protein
VSELHLDERIQNSREVLGKHLATGQKKVSTAFNSLWADIEAMREAQRRKAAEQKAAAELEHSTASGDVKSPTNSERSPIKCKK